MNADSVLFFLPKKYSGGMEISNQSLINHYADICNVFVFVHEGGRETSGYHNCRNQTSNAVKMYFEYLYRVVFHNPQVVFINGVIPLIIALLIPTRGRTVYQLHCTIDFRPLSKIKKMILKTMIGLFSRRSQVEVHCCSKGLVDEVRSYYFVDPGKVKWYPIFLNINQSDDISDTKKICFIGRLHDQKNISFMRKIFIYINNIDPSIPIEIMGEGDQKAELEQTLPFCKFVGWRSRPHSSENLVVFTSNYEGFGLVVLEALANNSQVFAEDVPHGPGEIMRAIAPENLIQKGESAKEVAKKVVAAFRKNSYQEKVIVNEKTKCYLAQMEVTRKQILGEIK